MFRVPTTPIIKSKQNCNCSLRYWSYFLCSYLPPIRRASTKMSWNLVCHINPFYFLTTWFSKIHFVILYCYIWIVAVYDAEIWELLNIDHKTLQISNCGPREGATKISRADLVKKWNITSKQPWQEYRTVKRRKTDCTGHVLHSNCPVKHVIEGKMEGMGRRERRRNQLLDTLKEKRIYWNLKVEALYRHLWRNRFGRGCGPFYRQTGDWM